MAPTRSKKRKSTESTISIDIPNPAPPQIVPTKMHSPARTPLNNRSPIRKKKVAITLCQKLALMDNLQLEITERARKLRAQYVLQAQGLKTRLEIRINRIPAARRQAKMGDLLLGCSETLKGVAGSSRAALGSPNKNLISAGQYQSRVSPSLQRSTKRMSAVGTFGKENEDIGCPTKRTRGAPLPPARSTSKINPSQILSPRSANSRSFPRSPIRPNSPARSMLARPVSPVKPMPAISSGPGRLLSNMVEKAKSTRSATTARKAAAEPKAEAGRRKKTVPPSSVAPRSGRGTASSNSQTSDSSTNTVVRKQVPVRRGMVKEKASATKMGVLGTIRGMGAQKKVVAAAKTKAGAGAEVGTAPVAGGRVLRKRN